MQYLWILWDLAAVLLIAGSVRSCARRGLIRTLLSFLSYFISAFVARSLSPKIALFLYGNVVEEALVEAANREMGALLAEGRDKAVAAMESFPRFLRQYLPVQMELAGGPWAAMDQGELVSSLVEATLREPVLMLLQSLCFFAVFALTMMAARMVARLFTGIYRLPLIGPLNTFLGGVTGLLQAVVFLVVGGFVIELVIVLTGGGPAWLNAGIMDDTYIWRVFYLMAGGTV